MLAALTAVLLAASPAPDAPVAEEEFQSRILQGTVILADGEHDIWVLKLEEGDALNEMPTAARLVPMESWVLLGRERAENYALIQQLQSKPEWWMLGAGLGLGIALGITGALLLNL